MSRVVVISDGDPDPVYDTFITKHNVELQRTDRLMLLEHGAAFLQNRIEQFLKQPTPWLIKMDPDTATHRRFKYLPDYEVFGNVQYSAAAGPCVIDGGFVGMTLEAAQKMDSSDVLSSPDLDIKQWPTEVYEEALLYEDVVFSEACMKCKLEIGPFPDVRGTHAYLPNRKIRYAFTHPNKEMIL
jgi:hypothetical protein